jgi:hypothetical protein
MTTAPASASPVTRPRDEPSPAGVVMLARAEWPASPGDELPAVPGFVLSSFSPLVIEVARRCLSRYFGTGPADPARGERTAVVLASSTGDIATAAAIAAAVDEGRRVQPLLFFQSNPNAAVGYLTARWGLAGPVVCTVPGGGDAMSDAQHCATLLIEGGDADAVLIILADQARDPTEQDHGVALLIGPRSWPAAAGGLDFPPG